MSTAMLGRSIIDIAKDFFQTIGDFFVCLPQNLYNVLTLVVFVPLYFLFMGISMIALFAETVFKKLAGIDTIYLQGQAYGGGNGNGQDLVYAFIQNGAVQNVFWAIVGLSIILLFILTIVALIKSEFTLDLKASAKGPIFGRAFKSLANFLIVPVVTLISIIGVNYLTTSIYNLFSMESKTVVTKCFILGGYDANRARRNSEFAVFIQGEGTSGSPFSGGSEQVATGIDNAFGTFADDPTQYKEYTLHERAEAIRNKEYAPHQTAILGTPNGYDDFSIWHLDQVNYYYDLVHFSFVLAIGSGIVMAWTLLTVCLVLVKRVFEMTILFLLAPPMTAIAPLDGGQAEKKWRQEFMKRLLSVVGPIFAYNMFFLIIPLFEEISLFGANAALNIGATAGSTYMLGSLASTLKKWTFIFDMFFQIICILTGLSVVKSASALLSNLLGIEDLIKSGGEAAKKAVDLGTKSFGLATAIGGVAFKGAAVALKAGKGVVSGVRNKFTAGGKSARDAKKKLKGAQEAADNADAAYDQRVEEIKGSDAYKANAQEIEQLEAKADRGALTKKETARLAALRSANDDMINKDGQVQRLSQIKEQAHKTLDERSAGISADMAAQLDANDKRVKELESTPHRTKAQDKELKKAKEFRSKVLDQMDHRSIIKNVVGAYDSEFGEDSGKTNLWGRVFNSINDGMEGKKKGPLGFVGKVLGKTPILGTRLKKHTKALSEYFNISGDTAVRRLNDMLGGVFGEGGGQQLWKINFNKNARASLFEGVPESKAREQGVQQGLLMEARKKYDKKEADKALEEDKLKELAKYFAQENNDPKYWELMNKRKKAEGMGNDLDVSKIDAQIEKFNVEHGYTARAREALKDKAFMNSDAYKKFRSGIKDTAYKDELDKEVKDHEFHEQMVSKYGDKPQKVTKSDEERAKEKEDLIAAFKAAMSSTPMKLDDSTRQAFETFAQSSGDLKTTLEALKAALDKLGGNT